MWSYLSPRSLISIQQQNAIRELDREIAEDHAAGYMVDVDAKLERRLKLQQHLEGRS